MNILGKMSIFSVAGRADGLLADSPTEGFWTITHRSSNSLGSFLLMTASSLLVNIWKGAEDSQSYGTLFHHRRGTAFKHLAWKQH